jgi:hypothetical protein
VTLKDGKKERQDWFWPIRTLKEQPTRMLLSAHLISTEIDQQPEDNG